VEQRKKGRGIAKVENFAKREKKSRDPPAHIMSQPVAATAPPFLIELSQSVHGKEKER
jgi:hypothetical protein